MSNALLEPNPSIDELAYQKLIAEFISLRRRSITTQKEVATYINDHEVAGLHTGLRRRKLTDRTISRWENNKTRMPPYAFKALRALIAYKRQKRIESFRSGEFVRSLNERARVLKERRRLKQLSKCQVQ
jgi:transcriptional regulator with XRE-family HTH domain